MTWDVSEPAIQVILGADDAQDKVGAGLITQRQAVSRVIRTVDGDLDRLRTVLSRAEKYLTRRIDAVDLILQAIAELAGDPLSQERLGRKSAGELRD